MSLRMLSGDSKSKYYNLIGEPEPLGARHDQIMKSAGTGPQLSPVYESLSTAYPVTVLSRNMNVDGSVTPVRFSLQVLGDQVWVISRLLFIIRDNGSMDSGGWGNNGGSPLDVGMNVGVTIDGVDYSFTPIPWTSHVDLGGVAYDVTYHSWGSGDTWLTMRLTIAKTGTMLRLDGTRGDTLWMDVQDDLTYLIEQRCMCQGVREGVYLG